MFHSSDTTNVDMDVRNENPANCQRTQTNISIEQHRLSGGKI